MYFRTFKRFVIDRQIVWLESENTMYITSRYRAHYS